jgi:hypothetical protein
MFAYMRAGSSMASRDSRGHVSGRTMTSSASASRTLAAKDDMTYERGHKCFRIRSGID